MLIYGHRGASGYAPENTIAAMDLAIKQGVVGVELDVQLTQDEELVVFHDWTVDRTTNGTGAIKDLTLEEIKKLDAGSWFSKEYEGEKVPTLKEILEFLPRALELNVEVKKLSTEKRDIEQKVVEILEKYDRIENTSISSFNHSVIKRVSELSDQIKIGALHEKITNDFDEYIKQNKLPLYSQNLPGKQVTEEIIKKVHAKGWKVYVWTVNDLSQAEKLREAGVDVIITNYPDIMIG